MIYLLPNTNYQLTADLISTTGTNMGADKNPTLLFSFASGTNNAGSIAGSTFTTGASGADTIIATDVALTGSLEFEIGTPESLSVTVTPVVAG